MITVLDHLFELNKLADIEKEIISYLNNNEIKDKFRLNNLNTDIFKIRLTERNNLKAEKNEAYIRGINKFWRETDNYHHFPTLISFIKNSMIFNEFGRILILINNKEETPAHTDHNYLDLKQEFVWIRPNTNKNLFICIDNEEVYVKNYCVWFNSRMLHGSKNSKFPSISIRVDGQFKDFTRFNK